MGKNWYFFRLFTGATGARTQITGFKVLRLNRLDDSSKESIAGLL